MEDCRKLLEWLEPPWAVLLFVSYPTESGKDSSVLYAKTLDIPAILEMFPQITAIRLQYDEGRIEYTPAKQRLKLQGFFRYTPQDIWQVVPGLHHIVFTR
jgi:hypothetical protein